MENSKYYIGNVDGFYKVYRKWFFGLFSTVVSTHWYHFQAELALAKLKVQEMGAAA